MREYILSGGNMTVVGQSTLLAIRPPASGRSLMISEARVSQSGTATLQQLGIVLAMKASAFPTLVSQTPQAVDRSAGASVITGGTALAAGTCGKNASAEGAGGLTILVEEAFSNTAGWLWLPTSPDQCIILPSGAADGLVLKLQNVTPTTLTGFCATLRFREI